MLKLRMRRVIGFEYKLRGERWRLCCSESDREVAQVIGKEVLRHPRTIPLPKSPQQHAGTIILALARHKLDGGFVHEELSEDRYRATIVVDVRREKPQPEGAA